MTMPERIQGSQWEDEPEEGKLPHDIISEEELSALVARDVMVIPFKDDLLHALADAWREHLILNGESIEEADNKFRDLVTIASLGNLRTVTVFHRVRASEALREPLIQLARRDIIQ
jgi:hypothetical protein